MIRKFRYKIPVWIFIYGIFALLSSASFFIVNEFDGLDYFFLIEVAGQVIILIVGIVFITQFLKHKFITLTDTFLELPVMLGKPQKINFSDIRFVTETIPGDGLLKISTVKEFHRINKRYMKPEEFDELKTLLKTVFKD